MHTLKLSVSLPDATHPDMELHLSADDAACDVVIALPRVAGAVAIVNAAEPPRADDTARNDDAYVLGGYAGI